MQATLLELLLVDLTVMVIILETTILTETSTASTWATRLSMVQALVLVTFSTTLLRMLTTTLSDMIAFSQRKLMSGMLIQLLKQLMLQQ